MIQRFIPAIACGAFIFYLSTGSNISLPQNLMDIFSMDKVGHFIAYGVFTILLLWAFIFPNSKWQKRGVRIALIFSILYGITMEVIQYAFFPNRYFEYLDIIANIIGSFTGLFLFNFFNRKT